MSLSPLKFSFGVSVLVHGVVISAAVWLGQFHRAPASVVVGDATTLELVAAPASAPEKQVEAVVTPVPPVPVTPLPPPPPPEEILPEKVVAPAPIAEEILPAPTPMPVIPVATVAAAAVPSANVGDHSSPTPGNNFTTAAGSPTAKAKPDYPKNPEPEYPLQARRRGQEGLVLLNITVSGSGHATEISLKQTSGYELLDQAALKAVQRWQFEPARIGAVGVESKIEVPVRFKLTR